MASSERHFSFTVRDGETLDQVVQRAGRHHLLGTIPGQVVWGSQHPDLVADVTADCRAVGLGGPERSTQPVCDSIIHLKTHFSPSTRTEHSCVDMMP